jgi:capsular polysaccharide biosynthesis protein
MAPEQADAARDVDHRADIYALGVVLYEMLTGERPRIPMPRPAGNTTTDDGIDAMVRRAMSQDPDERFQTAGELCAVAAQVAEKSTPSPSQVPPLATASRPPVVRESTFRRWWWVMLVMLLVGPLLGLLFGLLGAHLAPKKYESTAVVQVDPSSSGGMTRQFFATEFEVIIAKATLDRVSERLDLAMRWNVADSEVINILKGIISTDQIRGTDLIEIRVRHTSAQDAAEVANAVAQVYRQRGNELRRERMKKRSPTTPEALIRNAITIHELAEEARRPVSPKTWAMLIIGMAAGLLLAPFIGLLLIPILHKLFPRKR